MRQSKDLETKKKIKTLVGYKLECHFFIMCPNFPLLIWSYTILFLGHQLPVVVFCQWLNSSIMVLTFNYSAVLQTDYWYWKNGSLIFIPLPWYNDYFRIKLINIIYNCQKNARFQSLIMPFYSLYTHTTDAVCVVWHLK